MYIDILKKIVNNYKYYKDIAINLEWIKADSKYYDWYKKYPIGMFANIINFPENYVKNNFERAYVQTVLTGMAWSEEWEQDFWNIPFSERLKYMIQAENFYAGYMTYRELRMKPVTEEHLINEIRWHASYDSVSESEINSVVSYVIGAENIELGGSYSSDHTFISIKNNSIMITDCGIWD